jgi:hypothetical protein
MKQSDIENRDSYFDKLEYGLAGKSFHLVMDSGYEYAASFLSGEIVMWAASGEPFRWETYQCLKSDETTYFIVMQLTGQPLRTCRTLVLDLENNLVTMHLATQGGLPNRPRIVQAEISFGAIKQPGQTPPVRRHSYTADLVGRKITWTYSNGFMNTHIYMSEMVCRAWAVQRPPLPPDTPPERLARIKKNEEREKIWLYEEPIRCVKIKDGCYLVSFIEENMNKMDSAIGGNNLLILSNMKEGFDVGRSFKLNDDDNSNPVNRMLIAHGAYSDDDLEVEHLPSPYRV